MIARLIVTGLFVAAGGLLFVGQRLLLEPAAGVAVAGTPATGVDPEAAMLWEADRRGLPLRDPVVRDRLLRNMRFVDPDTTASDAVLLDRALTLGMHRSDAVARAALCQRVGDLLLVETPLEEASSAELQGYLEAHPERFRADERVEFRQLLFRAESDAAAAARAREALDTLRAGEGRGSEGLGDPTLLPARMDASASRVARAFGEGFARRLSTLPEGGWQGPVASRFGQHLVWVERRVAGTLPALDDVREAVRLERRHDVQQARRARLLEGLSQRYAAAVGEAR